MIVIERPAYHVILNDRSGTVEGLRTAADPADVNLAHKDGRSGTGNLVFTKRGEPWRITTLNSPIKEEYYTFDEERSFARFTGLKDGCHHFENRDLGSELIYEFADTHFDVTLNAALPEADQIGLDLNFAMIDLRQNDARENQFTVKSFYRAPDRSLAYLYLQRVGKKSGILLYSLTPCAGWRLRYQANFPIAGIQMLARFSEQIDDYGHAGDPVHLKIRVAFADSWESAKREMFHTLGLPLVEMPICSVEAGGALSYHCPEELPTALTVVGPHAERRELSPERNGHVLLKEEGFYQLVFTSASGKSYEFTVQATAPYRAIIARSRKHLKPVFGYCAEKFYWVQAMLLARHWLGVDERMEDYLHDALSCVGMQGETDIFPGRIPSKASSVERMSVRERHIDPFPMADGLMVGAPVPFAHTFQGKEFSPWHLYCFERIQDAFAYVQTFLYAARAYDYAPYLEQAVKIADAHLQDHLDTDGLLFCRHGGFKIDYTTVISPALALTELYRELRDRRDPRAERYADACIRIADYLVRRGMEFPTEGCFPHERWTEDGSIACTALSLLAVNHWVKADARYTRLAREILDFHDAWRFESDDVRTKDGTFRYWETQWENDGEGHSLNAGHPWGLWRGEALFLLGIGQKDAEALRQSYNCFRNNLAKFNPDGSTSACFTPDDLPERPVRLSLCHCYPKREDVSISYYLWPRLQNTWWHTTAVIPGADGEAVVLNGEWVEENGKRKVRSYASECREWINLTDLQLD